MDPLLRATLVRLYGEENVLRMERASRPPADDDQPPTDEELQRIADEAEAARFAAEIERDAALGSHADWPDL